MDDGRLRAVLTAVDRGSFSKAAAELGYTQSAMTHLVNNLEAELGCTLLNRGSHGVRLSEEGEQLLPYIKGVIDACDALRQEAAAQSRTQRHQLSLGCFASIARSALPQLLQEFKALYPDIQIDVTIRGYEMPALLQKGEVQLALVDETCAEGFEWIPLTRVPLIAVVPPTFRWERERISIGRLLKEPFITCQEQYSEKLLPPGRKAHPGHGLGRCGDPVHGVVRPGSVDPVVALACRIRGAGQNHTARDTRRRARRASRSSRSSPPRPPRAASSNSSKTTTVF